MKRSIIIIAISIVVLILAACSGPNIDAKIVTTTMPVYTFTRALCQGTPLTADLLIQENVSCLHDYTLTVKHMKMLENADLIIISGGGLEDFLSDTLPQATSVIDSSAGIQLHCYEDAHDHDHNHGHHHDTDPHFWLSIAFARQMAHNIYEGLRSKYPQHQSVFEQNLVQLDQAFDALQQHANDQLQGLNCRELVTFHDGFSYMAEGFNLTILYSIEEESGSEASAKDIIQICNLVAEHSLPAIFVEKNGSDSAAKVICRETGAKLFELDMAMSGGDYFEVMYSNIDTLKEALG